MAPRYLGLETVLAKSFARIHWQNLINFGALPLTFADPADYDALKVGDVIEITAIRAAIEAGPEVTASVNGTRTIRLKHDMSPRQLELLFCGGVINWLRERIGVANGSAATTNST